MKDQIVEIVNNMRKATKRSAIWAITIIILYALYKWNGDISSLPFIGDGK